jgi:hypothetical protein
MFKNLHAMAFAAKASAPTTMTLKGFAYQVLDPRAFHTNETVDDYRIFPEPFRDSIYKKKIPI